MKFLRRTHTTMGKIPPSKSPTKKKFSWKRMKNKPTASGGVAAKNPHLVESRSFRDEFDDGRAYRHILERIPVYLNRDEHIGIKGAAIHAWLQLSDPSNG